MFDTLRENGVVPDKNIAKYTKVLLPTIRSHKLAALDLLPVLNVLSEIKQGIDANKFHESVAMLLLHFIVTDTTVAAL